MIIELSRVQFDLRSSAQFQNQTNLQYKFILKSPVQFRKKLHKRKTNYHLIASIFLSFCCCCNCLFITSNRTYPFWNCKILIKKMLVFSLMVSLPIIFLQSDWLLWTCLEIWLVVFVFLVLFSYKVGKEMQFRVLHCREPIRLQGSSVISKWMW